MPWEIMTKIRESLSSRELEILHLIGAGSSDREISQKLYLSINTVKWHNRQIYAKLGVSSRTEAVSTAGELGLLDDQTLEQTPVPRRIPHNLPAQVSSFVGREKEINEIKDLLDISRLLTLTGPGGVGKTRLALQVAAQLLDQTSFDNGMYFVELAPVSNPDRVGEAILEGLHLTATAGQKLATSLKIFFEDRKSVLILDNFEHILQAASLVLEMLESSPGLKILCTSREALNLSGEQVFPVPPLTLPDLSARLYSEKLLDFESVDLFIRRTQGVKPGLTPDEKDLTIIAEICTRLDGLPLAIELAAARARFFSLTEIHNQIENRFIHLKDGPRDFPQRHETLRRAIDWSYDLLDEEEQIFFNRLSAFQGSRTIEAVEVVCCLGLTLNVLDGLESLCVKSLIQQEVGLDGETRFYLLETIHEYTREKLQESGEVDQILRRHALYFVEQAEKGKYPSRGGPDQIRWLNRFKADQDNFRSMFDWSMEQGEYELALRLVCCLDFFWLRMGSFDEAAKWSAQVLSVIDQVPEVIQAGVYGVTGLVSYLVNIDRDTSISMFEKSLKIWEKIENKREIGWTHIRFLDPMEMIAGYRKQILDHFNKGVSLLREVDDKVGIAYALTVLGVHEHITGSNSEARKAYAEGLAIAEEAGDVLRVSILTGNLGDILCDVRDFGLAKKQYQESLKIRRNIGFNQYFGSVTLIDIAWTEIEIGDIRKAVVLLSASDGIFKYSGSRPQPPQYKYIDRINSLARSKVTEEIYESAWAEGQAMTPDEAVAFALEEDV